MGISLSGMSSGLDTDAIISELVKAYSTKKDNIVKQQTKHEWKQDAWKDMNSKIYSFYSGPLSTMRFSSGYNLKKATSTSTKATITAGTDAVNGTQSLKINKLATSGYLTGGEVDKITKDDGTKADVKGSTNLKDMGIESGSAIGITVNGKETSIKVTDDMTINNLVSKLKDAGVNASFDEKNQRFFVSSKKSGKEADFSLVGDNSKGTDALSKLGLLSYSSKDIDKYKQLAAMDSDAKAQEAYDKKKTLDTTKETEKKNLQKEVKDLTASLEKLNKQKKTADYKKEYVEKLTSNGYTKEDAENEEKDIQSKIDELNKSSKDGTITDEQKQELADYKVQLAAVKDVNAQINKDYATSLDENGELSDEDITAIIDKYTSEADDIDTKIAESTDKLNADNDILNDATEDSLQEYVDNKNADIASKNATLLNDLKNYYADQKVEAQKIVAENAAGKLTSSATRIVGEDAEIELNGATFKSNTNNFSINGLTIAVNATTDDDETIGITTDTDVDGLYDKIKDFFTQYNSLINEMDSKFNAPSAKGYEPLTDEEKEAMTDDEIEKWETKVKDALLRRDGTLDAVSNAIKNAFMKSYTVNGKSYSLSSFGIKTAGYFSSGDNEKNAYHIDGDEDDSAVSGNADKLKKILASDPDTFMNFFTKLTQDVYDTVSKKMKGTSLSSAYTVYNDKQMQNEQKTYKKKISEWEKKIEDMESKYRKQFTAMETAMSKLNSQSTQLAGLLGM